MTALKISLVLTVLGVLALADKPPTGPEVHHITGQEGFDSFGKTVAGTPIYGGANHDIGVASHPVSYGHAPSHGYGAPPPSHGYGAPPPSHGYGAPPPSHGYGAPPALQTVYIAYEPPQPAPQYHVKVKSNPLKELDKKIKDYASKFTKFISKGFKKDYKKGGDDYYQPSYPTYPTYPVYYPQPARYYPRAPAPHYAKPPTTYYPQPPKYGSYH